MIKPFSFLIIGIVSNIGVLTGIKYIFEDRIIIIFNIEKNLLLLSLLIFWISLGVVSYILSKVLKIPILQILWNLIIIITIWWLGINIITVIKAIYNIITYNDIIYSCRLFDLQYLYKEEELINYIGLEYQKLWKAKVPLSYEWKVKILNNAKTIAEARSNIEAYCNYESTAIWSKVINLLNKGLIIILDQPNIVLFWTLFIWVLVSYYGYGWLKTKIDMYNMARYVTDLNGEITNINESIWHLSKWISSNNKWLTLLSQGQKLIGLVLWRYIKTEFDYLGENSAISGNKNEFRVVLVELQKVLAKLVASQEELESLQNIKANTNKMKPFTGTGYRLGNE